MPGQGMGIDEFLGHKGQGASYGGYLRNWRKEGEITVWLHTKNPFFPVWGHQWPRLVERKPKDDDETPLDEQTIEIWGGRFNCLERESVLRRQHFRDKAGNREFPPVVCPACMLIERVREMVRAGQLSWTQPLFVFEGSDPQKTKTLTAGGIYNAFNGDLTREQLAELRKAGIRRDEAFQQVMNAKLQYAFAVVDNGDVGAGVQKTIEAQSLGDKLKRAINAEMRRAGKNRDRGNPCMRPYPFEWSYDESKHFNERYDAIALGDEECPDEVRVLIVNDELPDMSEYTDVGDVALFRAQVEAARLVELPLDEIFEAAENGAEQEPEPQPRRPAPAPARPAQKAAPAPVQKAQPKQQPAAAKPAQKAQPKQQPKQEVSEDADDVIGCDHCQGEMSETDFVCPHCGASYDLKAGILLTRPCLAEGCGDQVELDRDPNNVVDGSQRSICGTCGAIHEEQKDADGDVVWAIVESPAPARTTKRPTRSQALAAQKRAKAAGDEDNEDQIPWGRS